MSVYVQMHLYGAGQLASASSEISLLYRRTVGRTPRAVGCSWDAEPRPFRLSIRHHFGNPQLVNVI